MKEKFTLMLLALLSACNVELKTTDPTTESTETPATYPTETAEYYPIINSQLYNVNHIEITEIYVSASEIINFHNIPEMRSYYTVWGINIDTNERVCIADDINEIDISDYHWEWLLIPGQKVIEIYRNNEESFTGNLYPVESFDGWY